MSNTEEANRIRSELVNIFLKSLQQRGYVVTKYQLDNNVTKAGTNFCSGISKLLVHFEAPTEGLLQKSYILKMPALSVFYEKLKTLNMYTNETIMYNEVLPDMYYIWTEEPFTVTNYLPPETDNLVLDDLTDAGYQVMEKKYQLDEEHAKKALQMLARFHALSVKLYESPSKTIGKVTRPPKIEDQEGESQSNSLFDKFGNTVALLEIPESTVQFLQQFQNVHLKRVFDQIMEPSDGFNVLCHGDFWSGNMMFKHDVDGKVVDVKLLDFQLPHRSSPVVDLIEFFITSVRFEVFAEKYEELRDTYLGTLNGTLGKLNCGGRYTEEEFERDMEKYRYYMVYNMGAFLPSVLSENEDPFNFSGQNTVVYKSKAYQEALYKWVQYLISKKCIP